MTTEVRSPFIALSDRGASLTHVEGNNDWDVKNGDVRSYEETFQTLLSKRTFADIINERKKQGKKSLVIDLMGYGKVLEGIECEAGLAVALSDQRSPLDNKKSILITGNVLLFKTWEKINDWLTKQDVPDKKANLILCRPAAGIRGLTDNIDLHFTLLNNMWSLLSRDSGILFTQLPFMSIDSRSRILEWQKEMKIKYPKQDCEIIPLPPELAFLGGVARFTKTPDSPDRLPTLQELQKTA